jgi:hypothetical protein
MPMTRRITLVVAALALQLVALVLAHDLVYLARYGSRYGEALVHAGHGAAWSATVESTVTIAVALALAGALRLAQLGILVRRANTIAGVPSNAGRAGKLEAGRLLRIWLRIAPRMALLSVVLLTIQENLERSGLGSSTPGVGILLSPEYPSALWITIAVGLLVGLVAALFEWRRRVLLERLRIARATLPRRAPGASARPRLARWRPAASLLGRRSGLRAPPVSSAA